MTAIIISLLFLFTFLYYFINKREYAINVLIFSIPFSYTPFFTQSFGEFFPISITGILVVFYYLLNRSWNSSYIPNSFYKTLKIILLFFILIGSIMALIYYDDALFVREYYGEMKTQTSKLAPSEQFLYHLSNLLICVLFLNILRKHFQVNKNIYSAIYIFSLTIIINFIAQLVNIKSGVGVDPDDPRYSAFYTIFGFGIYITMVVIFSLVFKFKYYKITLSSALLFGLLSGQRQAVFFPFIAVASYYIFSKGKILSKIFYTVIMVVIVYVMLFFLKNNIYSIERIWISINFIENDMGMEATGRDVLELPKVINALKEWPIMGKGLYNWGYFIGIKSYYADHVLIANIYQKFGLIGFLIFTGSVLYFLIIVIKRLISSKYKKHLIMIFSLTIVFIGHQFIDNFFWFTNTMLLYIFMFSLFFSLMGNNVQNYSIQDK